MRNSSVLTAGGILLLSLVAGTLSAAPPQDAAEPIVGLRDDRPQLFALTGATVVNSPGERVEDATVLIRGTSIRAVGTQVDLPAACKVIDCSGKLVYPGLIDAWSEVDVEFPNSDTGYWNKNISPERTAASTIGGEIENAKKLREQGITVRAVAPRGGIVKGSSAAVLLSDTDGGRRLLRDHLWQHAQLSVPRSGPRTRYPNSPMGAVALLRQSLYDAAWYQDAWNAYRADRAVQRPQSNRSLAILADAVKQDTFVIDAPNERMALRADQLAREFSLKLILRGSGREYRELDEIAATGRPILLPVDFPDTPDVKTLRSARETSLQELMHWDLAAENPARLAAAGVSICLTTDGLDNVGDFLARVRTAVDRGLSAEQALAAMTTTPAQLMGIEQVAGQIGPGMLANLVVADGDLFEDSTKILETWVAGERFETSAQSKHDEDPLVGSWRVKFNSDGQSRSLLLDLKSKNQKYTGELSRVNVADPESGDDQTDEQSEAEEKTAKLADVVRQRDRLTATVELAALGDDFAAGTSRITILTFPNRNQPPLATIELADAEPQELRLTREPEAAADQTDKDQSESEEKTEDDAATGDEAGSDADDPTDPQRSDEAVAATSNASTPSATPLLYPLGAYGVEDRNRTAEHVMFQGATIWTCDEAGIIESGDMIVKDGRIVEIGKSLTPPEGCRVIKLGGKHITPGLIDCHSHMGTDGGVNESGQAVTAEVRIGDFIDNSDITIFRQLAGGLTTSNILHGSANPIGGQNQVIKLRWGQSMDDLRMSEAPAGIKFALGENVKRNQSRYPNTRMGVEQIIRDQLLAAREYDARWRRWRSGQRDGLPPRKDLQLEAMAEVQRGERWIHCHSYRQDEIVATLDVLEEFGVQIGTLQHILEGYKVADRMAQHGAMASAFSDWWAYKFEVYDAIPYNGAVMHDRGVVVSFNSDDRELGRRLNTEAAKATKYGGVSEQEALKFVTLNPARQLRIDEYVGSLSPGKHADLVVWSGPPLSTMTRCEQTWIDGRRYFDLESEQEMRARDSRLRKRLIQKALDGEPSESDREQPVAEEDRWLRYDEFCSASGSREQRSVRAMEETNE